MPPFWAGAMRIAFNVPAIFLGILLGGSATMLALTAVAWNSSSAVWADPFKLFWLAVVVAIPSALYGLMRYEDRNGRQSKPGSELPPAIVDARAEIERQFARFFLLIAEQLKNAQRHSNVLDLLNNRLDGEISESELRSTIQKLIASNEIYRNETADLERRLEKAKAQAKEFRVRAQQAERLASVDPLTGVANRRKLDEELATQVTLSHVDETPLCLMLADIDHFKVVNDTFGHRAGDAVLRQFAELLGGMVRTTDLVARYGGEEFAIILPRAPLGNAYEIAERIRNAIQSHSWNEVAASPDLKITSSFGIADIRDGETAIDLINRADTMLYEAKKRGRNRTVVHVGAAQ